MFLLTALGQTLAGFWRLLIGVILGTVLYVYCFLYQESLYLTIHDLTRTSVNWLKQQPWLIEHAKWNEILSLDDKLAFALYVLFARLVWMFFESIFVYLFGKAR